MPEVLLSSGTYATSAAIMSQGSFLDYLDRYFEVRVRRDLRRAGRDHDARVVVGDGAAGTATRAHGADRPADPRVQAGIVVTEPEVSHVSENPAAPDPLDLPAGLLADVLSALVLDVPDRALQLLDDAELDAELRVRLRDAVQAAASTAGAPRRSATNSARAGRWLDPDVIECYRVAFYTGPDWEAQLDNPLFARFAAKRAGLPYDKWPHYFDIYRRTLAPHVGARGAGAGDRRVPRRRLDQLRRCWARRRCSWAWMSIPRPKLPVPPLRRGRRGPGRPGVPALGRRALRPFDVIIDDGGHTMAQQITSIECLFPRSTTVASTWWRTPTRPTGALPGRRSDVHGGAKARLDDINGYHFRTEAELGVWTASVTAIHVYDSIVVLDKGRHQPPFCEVAGSGSFVYGDRITESVLLSYRASLDTRTQELQQARDFAGAALSDRQQAVDFGLAADELRSQLSAEVEQLRTELAAERERAAEDRARLAAEANLAEAERQRAGVRGDRRQAAGGGPRECFPWRLGQRAKRLRRRS